MRDPRPMVGNRGQATLDLRKITMDQLASMRIFLAVAEANALNGAARHLGLSPSAVSKHIAALKTGLAHSYLPAPPAILRLPKLAQPILKIVGKFWLILTRQMPKHEVPAVPFRGIYASKPHRVLHTAMWPHTCLLFYSNFRIWRSS